MKHPSEMLIDILEHVSLNPPEINKMTYLGKHYTKNNLIEDLKIIINKVEYNEDELQKLREYFGETGQ